MARPTLALATTTAAMILAVAASPVSADNFPIRPVRFINQGAVGSDPDVVARLLADRLALSWKQPIVVDNRPGGGGVIAGQASVKATPDGHTFFFAAASGLTIAPYVGQKAPYDPERDFVPVAMITENPFAIAVRTSLQFRGLPDLIEYAAKNPKKVNYAANAAGTFPHLVAELFASRAGVQLHFVPYRGQAAALQDLMGGRIDMIVSGMPGISSAVDAGHLRLLAITSERRLRSLPEIPVVGEFVPGYAVAGWFMLVAPSKTPASIVKRVHNDLRQALEDPAIVERLAVLATYPRYMTREQCALFMRKERDLWAPLAQQLELKNP